ncbi:hybrid sensor histidine kinase/response regulator, partial [Massilia arenosa]
ALAPATADPLLALASEMRIATRALPATAAALQRLKRQQASFLATLDAVQTELQAATHPAAARLRALLQDGQAQQQALLDQLASLDHFERRQSRLAGDLVHEVLALRMRPFGDGVHAFPRMVRDLARSLGKEARLVIEGSATLVDRDVLARIESPLNHLLRNAVDHGLELPAERAAAGKPPAGTLTLTARHRGGLLAIELADDGRGVDCEKIRARVIERRMAPPALAAAMTQAELLDFLFLPAFSLKDSPTAISGRGVGLDLVQDAVRAQNGSVRLASTPGRGLTVSITLPVTQSVVRALVCEIGGEPYAVPIASIGRVLSVPRADLPTLEGKPFVDLRGERIGLVPAAPLLGLEEVPQTAEDLPVLVLGPAGHRYGLVVEKLRGEASLVVQPLEPVFGKLRDLAAAAVLDDGSPVLILDVADLLHGVERQLAAGSLQPLAHQAPSAASAARRVLVVDDSLTVREMERQLLVARGYTVDVAVDGMDGWNMVRARGYDLVITDVDMPRLDGIELTTMIRRDPRLRALPVMIVSYKDRPEDRARGLSAGADYYLTKGAFHDATLLDAVHDLIGGAA